MQQPRALSPYTVGFEASNQIHTNHQKSSSHSSQFRNMNKDESLSRASGLLSVGIDDKAMFALAGVNQDAFYANAYVIASQDRGRCWTSRSTSFSPFTNEQIHRSSRDHPEHGEQFKNGVLSTRQPEIDDLLDCTALLCARAKRVVTHIKQDKPSPADNVTATMYVQQDAKGPGTIYLAKNAGPQAFLNGVDDREAVQKLETWYNDHCADVAFPEPTAADPTWKFLQRLWWRRSWYYWSTIMKANKDYGRILSSESEQLPDERLFHAACRTPTFLADLNHLRKLLTWLPEDVNATADDARLLEIVDRVCFEDRYIWEHSFSKPVHASDAQPSLYEVCRKLVKHFKLLGFMRSLWEAFSRFHSRNPGVKLIFRFLPGPSISSICSEEFKREFLRARDSSTHPDKPKKVRGGKLDRFCHCELQLLQLLRPDRAATEDPNMDLSYEHVAFECIHPYFGCSKLSCFLCWEFLQSLGLSTRDTHGKLCSSCAFPLHNLGHPYREQVATRLKNVADVLGRAVQGPKETTKNSLLAPSDTQPIYLVPYSSALSNVEPDVGQDAEDPLVADVDAYTTYASDNGEPEPDGISEAQDSYPDEDTVIDPDALTFSHKVVWDCAERGCDRTYTGLYAEENRARHERQNHDVYRCEVIGCRKWFRRPDARYKHQGRQRDPSRTVHYWRQSVPLPRVPTCEEKFEQLQI